MATAGVMLLKGPQARRYTQKAVHTQGGTHKRRCVATAGVVLFKGPQARRYTQKAVHTQGRSHKRRSVVTAGFMLLKGPQARQYTQKAVHTQGGTHKRRSVATAGVLLLIYRGGGLLVHGGITRGGDGLNRTDRPAEGPAGLPAIFSAKTRGG